VQHTPGFKTSFVVTAISEAVRANGFFPAAWQRPPLNPNGMPKSHGSGNEGPFSRSDAMEKPLVKKL
jgi:hypothetical protein